MVTLPVFLSVWFLKIVVIEVWSQIFSKGVSSCLHVRNNADIWNSCRKLCMKRQPQWLQQGNCSRLSRSDVNTAGTIQMPSTCSWESSSLHQSSGPQMVLLAWWDPCKKLAYKRKKGLDCIVLSTKKSQLLHIWTAYILLTLNVNGAESRNPAMSLLCVIFNWMVSSVGVLAVKERLHWGWWRGCRVWRGAVYSRNCGGLEPGQSEPSLQCVQGLYCWQPCAAGRPLDIVLRIFQSSIL